MNLKALALGAAAVALVAGAASQASAEVTYVYAGSLSDLNAGNTADTIGFPSAGSDGVSLYYWEGGSALGELNVFLTATNSTLPENASFIVYTTFSNGAFSGAVASGSDSLTVGLATSGRFYSVSPFYIVQTSVSDSGSAFGGSVSWAAAVPEPSTWALMGLGFAGLAFTGYRSRRTVRVVA